MSHYGDFRPGDTVYMSFTTVKASPAGTPVTLSGSPVISVYKNADDTQSTSGVTLEVDADGRTGWNRVTIVTTNAFYANRAMFHVLITTGTIDGVSAVGYRIGSFTLGQQPYNILSERNTGGDYGGGNTVAAQVRKGGGGTTGVAFSGTLSAGSNSTVTLPVGASAQNDAYKGWAFISTGGAGLNQTARLVTYNGSTRVGVLDRTVPVPFNGTTVFDMYVGSSSLAVEEGVAQAGNATTITARSGASTVNDAYTGWQAVLTSGTPDFGEITDYVGATRVGTVSWAGAGAAAGQNYAFFPPVATAQDSGGGTTAPTVSELVAGIRTVVLEGALTLEEILRIILSAVAGTSEDHETNAPKYKSVDGLTTRIDATTDANGNRLTTELDGS